MHGWLYGMMLVMSFMMLRISLPSYPSLQYTALCVKVLAGYDGGLDPRQPPNMTAVPQYSKMVRTPSGDTRLIHSFNT